MQTDRNEEIAHAATPLSLSDALRALDTMARLLETISDNKRAAKLRKTA